jgi:hypothetical protein
MIKTALERQQGVSPVLRVPSGNTISDAPPSSAAFVRATGSSLLPSRSRSMRMALKTSRPMKLLSGP